MILVTGARGQLGYELARALAPLGDLAAVDVDEMPLQDPDAIRAVLRRLRPRLVVNAGAYTAVDRAEDEPDLAQAVNGAAPGVIAGEMRRLGGAVVHYSTDYVFDGSSAVPYREGDEPRPLNVYGRTKLAGEEAVRASGAPHLVLRTSWVYGARGRNFLHAILARAAAGEPLRVVSDQHGAPTWCRMLAEATACVLARTGAAAQPEALREPGGLYHLTAGGATTWHGFATAILALAPGSARRPADEVAAIATGDFPTKATRPRNSRLDCSRLRETFGVALPDWRTSLEAVMEDLRAG